MRSETTAIPSNSDEYKRALIAAGIPNGPAIHRRETSHPGETQAIGERETSDIGASARSPEGGVLGTGATGADISAAREIVARETADMQRRFVSGVLRDVPPGDD